MSSTRDLHIREQINTLRVLSSGWDGEKALVPDPKLINALEKALFRVNGDLIPYLYPVQDGRIDVEYRNVFTSTLDHETLVIHFYKNKQTYERSLIDIEDDIVKSINEFISI
jgi:hypothetical protein